MTLNLHSYHHFSPFPSPSIFSLIAISICITNTALSARPAPQAHTVTDATLITDDKYTHGSPFHLSFFLSFVFLVRSLGKRGGGVRRWTEEITIEYRDVGCQRAAGTNLGLEARLSSGTRTRARNYETYSSVIPGHEMVVFEHTERRQRVTGLGTILTIN